MDQGPALILKTLDGFMTGPGLVRLFGGAAFILGRRGAGPRPPSCGRARSPECLALLEGAGRQLDPVRWRHSIEEAIVPAEYRDLFQQARPRAVAMATTFGG